MRAHLYAHNDEFQLARKVFHEMLNKNPSSLDACQGLVNVDSQEESAEELKQMEKRIEEAIRLSKENTENTTNLRDFKLLRAQIRVLEGKFDDALNFYKELEKEESGDFRVYLCQVLVYMLLNRKGEAEISLEKYRRLVPEGHLFERYFDDDNLNAAKAYAHKVENERNRGGLI
ncbi:protein slow green 1 chloroplastic [Phtheirospermum japonicum]|uniref:Protein slow green 1 chloroplastic n=1 Tax=Phtheirospermum japonicum TaxID=374723 RepID=A0A830B846_9LAMI|nr:protein slow green 1 chloroplastic [Phtheirospermum japonicum]